MRPSWVYTGDMPIITICSSANFYRQVVVAQAELEALGYQAIIPATAEKMKESGDYDVSHYRTWLANAQDYHKKTALMRKHFDEVAKGDASLIVNYEKHGINNYIGGNVLMEMTLAFYLKKPIFILNDIPDESSYLEEIIGMEPVVLHGKLANIKKHLVH
jgi:hypothetical protein